MAYELTRGAIQRIVSGEPHVSAVLQVAGVKKVQNAQQPAQDRYRILLSDGQNSYGGMLATQLTEMASNGAIKEGSIVQLVDYLCNQVQEKRIIIILNMSVLALEAPPIGNPVVLKEKPGAPAAAGPPAAGQNMAPNLQYGAPPPAGGYGAAPAGPPGGMYGGPPNSGMGGGNQYGGGPGGYGGGSMNPQQQRQQYGAPPNSGAPMQQPYGAPPSNPYGAPQGGNPGNPYGSRGGGGGGPQYGQPPANTYGQQGGGGGQYRGGGGGHGPVARNDGPANVMPINSLNSYQNRWTIKARVTAKSDIRRFSNARGEGKFFTFDLLDAQGGEIRCYGWNDACDKYIETVELGQVYMISKASLRNKRGNFNQVGQHQYEIHLENQSQLELCPEDNAIPRIHYNFRPISELEDTPANNTVDIIAVVESVNDWAMITKKDGGETQKRSLIVRDSSLRSIELTLWGGYAHNPGDQLFQMVQAGQHPVLAVKSARVGDYNGKTLSTVGSTTIFVDPVDIPEAGRERNWYDNGGGAMQTTALSSARAGGGRADRRIFLSQIKDEGLGMGGAPAWVQVAATCTYVKDKQMYYAACPLQYNGKQCNKKMQDQGGGSWFCERCNQTAAPEWRYILSVILEDHTHNTWATAFAEAAPDLLGVSAGQMKEFEDNGEHNRISHAMQSAMFRPLLLKLKVNEDTWNDEQRVRVSIIRVEPTDLVKECRSTIENIYKLQRGEPILQPAPQQGGQGQFGGGGGGGYGGDMRSPGFGGQGQGGQYGGGPGQQQQQYGSGYNQGGGGGYNQGGGGGYNQGGGYGGGPQQYGGGGFQQQQQQGGWQGGPPQGGYGGGGGGGYNQGGYGGGGGW